MVDGAGKVKKTHRPLWAAGLLAGSIVAGYIAYNWARHSIDAPYFLALAGLTYALFWLMTAIAIFEVAFDFHIGRRQLSRKRNRPLLGVALTMLSAITLATAVFTVFRARGEAVHVAGLGVFLATLVGLLGISFAVIAIELQTRGSGE